MTAKPSPFALLTSAQQEQARARFVNAAAKDGFVYEVTPDAMVLSRRKPTHADAIDALEALRDFIGGSQRMAMRPLCRGEETAFFRLKLLELNARIEQMPTTYKNRGPDAVAYLHYFTPRDDWYITEKDREDEQLQAFGLFDLGQPEIGYVSIVDLLKIGAELDLHFSPTPVTSIKR